MNSIFAKMLIFLLSGGLITLTPSVVLSQQSSLQVAFPGAEGFGRLAQGGRGGQVIAVTNLDDLDNVTGLAVPGSLRAAIEATGPRIVVFRVSGTINVCEQNRQLSINNPYITIAGQTAPGDGIALRLDPACGRSAIAVFTHNVIIRHLRIRPGSNPLFDTGGSDAISISGVNAHDIIIDHCSMTWATDEDLNIGNGAHDVTVQWSLIAEGLKNAPRPNSSSGPSGGYGCLIDEGDTTVTTNLSLHHNLFANNSYRNPQIDIKGSLDYVNNVIYNWNLHGFRARDIEGNLQVNLIGNYAKRGPITPVSNFREFRFDHTIGYTPFSFYVRDNIGPKRPTANLPQLDIIYCRENTLNGTTDTGVDCDPARFAVNSPFDAPPITRTDALTAYNAVRSGAGAILPRRDVVDTRIINEVANGTGGLVTDPATVGGWPILNSTTAPLDSDGDGMPNSWENTNGFNRNSATDGPLDRDGDGFTNIEEYLNGNNPSVADVGVPDQVAPAPPSSVRAIGTI